MLENVPHDWIDLMNCDDLKELAYDVEQATTPQKMCPPQALWFEWARMTPLDSVSVIIIGQDPYHDGSAHGLAFSSMGRIPPSLRNIFKTLHSQGLISKMPTHGNLSSWAEQGVLLLNIALSTESGRPMQHVRFWRKFTEDIVRRLSDYGREHGREFKFLLWGDHARKFERAIDARAHQVLKWRHPSPLANTNRIPAHDRFINCTHFMQCTDIDWDSVNDEASDYEIVEYPVFSGLEVEAGSPAALTHASTPARAPPSIEVPAEDPHIHRVFTDGACSKNGRKGAFGAWAAIFVSGPRRGEKFAEYLPDTTNIRAEGLAISAVLRMVLAESGAPDSAEQSSVEIYTDSEFWRDMLLTYMPKWSPGKFDAMKNPDITKELWRMWCELDGRARIVFVPAHNKRGGRDSRIPFERWAYKWNDEVDRLATATKNSGGHLAEVA